jgi:hypothetical protein
MSHAITASASGFIGRRCKHVALAAEHSVRYVLSPAPRRQSAVWLALTARQAPRRRGAVGSIEARTEPTPA